MLPPHFPALPAKPSRSNAVPPLPCRIFLRRLPRNLSSRLENSPQKKSPGSSIISGIPSFSERRSYDHKVSEVHWTDQETKTTYKAACGFDIGLIAGVQRFVHHGEQYAIDMLHSDVNTTPTRDAARKYNYEVPKVSAGQIIITQGDPKNPYATAPLSFIKELIESEKERLTTYQSDRQKYWEEASAWAKAHPPIPQDETVQLRPHRGSRYLADPQPEKTEGTR